MKPHDLHIRQGSTFSRVLRWGAGPLVYKAITGISQGAPARVNAVGHGIPDGWQVAIVSVQGMTEINAPHSPPVPSDFVQATLVDSSHIDLNSVNSAGFTTYDSGGYVMFYTPVDLTGYTARMEIKDHIGGTVLATFTSADAIAIDPTGCTITLTISATATAAYTWEDGVYDLELVSPGGVVTALLCGDVHLREEVTT